jgi:hypothetical protein
MEGMNPFPSVIDDRCGLFGNSSPFFGSGQEIFVRALRTSGPTKAASDSAVFVFI